MKCTIVTIVLGLASLAICAPITYIVRQTSLEQITDKILFGMSLDEFITYRNTQIGPAELDWSSNGCTSTPDHPFGFVCALSSLQFSAHLTHLQSRKAASVTTLGTETI